MKKTWTVATMIAVCLGFGPALSEDKASFKVNASQMETINDLLFQIDYNLGSENIYSLLITRLDESGEELPVQQLVTVGEEVRTMYLMAASGPPEACLNRYNKESTWYDTGALLRSYFCQHPAYVGPGAGENRKLRQDLYYEPTLRWWDNVKEEINCLDQSGNPNHAEITPVAFQKLCKNKIN